MGLYWGYLIYPRGLEDRKAYAIIANGIWPERTGGGLARPSQRNVGGSGYEGGGRYSQLPLGGELGVTMKTRDYSPDLGQKASIRQSSLSSARGNYQKSGTTMARSISSVCAFVCSGKSSLFPTSALARKSSSLSSAMGRSRAYGYGKLQKSLSTSSSLVLESPLGPVDFPSISLTDHVFRDFEEFADRPAIVSDSVSISCVRCYGDLP